MRHLVVAFKLSCIIAAGFMIGFWIYKYHKNDDITLIEYKPMTELDDFVLPELTICLRNPVLNERMKKSGLKKSDYLKYLQGDNNSSKDFRNIEFHNVTLNIFDYFLNATMRLKSKKNQSDIRICSSIQNCSYFEFKNNYNVIINQAFLKCFGVEINKEYYKDMKYYLLRFDGKLKKVREEVSTSILSFNLPNQLLRNFRGNKPFRWSTKDRNGTKILEVTSVEVLKRRNKRNEQCMEDWMFYDNILEQSHIDNIGCRAPYQTSQNQLPVCSTEEKMKKVVFDSLNLAEKYPPPCQEMPDIAYNYGIDDADDFGDAIPLYVSFPDKWKIITLSKALDVHALIGNIGGYIGLFLGRIIFSKLYSKLK